MQAARGATLTASTGGTGSTGKTAAASVPGTPGGEAGPARSAAEPGAASASGATAGAGRPRRPRLVVVLVIAAAVLAADIVSKAVVVATLSGRQPVRLLGGFLKLVETRNPGSAFSLGGPSETILFSLIAIAVAVYVVRAARRIYSVAWAVALGLLLGGAVGNLVDRIFRAPGPFRGWVVDWIELPHWPVFNLADSGITCGAVLMVVLAVLGRGLQGRTGGVQARPGGQQGGPGGGDEDGAGRE